ncbi:MAG: hypothetical protein MJ235_08995 [archaeon]|nr:hypothetical protein [archaeon]
MSQAVKFKNVFAEEEREFLSSVGMPDTSIEGRVLCSNGQFIGALWNGLGGKIRLIDYNLRGNVPNELKEIDAGRQPVLDMEFSPHRSDLLATACDDNQVKLWQIPEGGLKEDLSEPVVNFKTNRKCTFVSFNPVATDVLTCVSGNPSLHVFSGLDGKDIVETPLSEQATWLSWNPDGSLVGVSLKNKTLNVFDPRANKMLVKSQVSEAMKSIKFTWIDNQTVAVVSFQKNNCKNFNIYDIRKVKDDLSFEAPVQTLPIDKSSSIAYPFYDAESELLFTCGKGETSVKCFYREEGVIKKGVDSQTNRIMSQIAFIPRRFVDYENCVVDRLCKFCNRDKTISFLSLKVPRRNPGYDPELYPDVFTGEPSMTIEEWKGGAVKEQVKKPIDTIEKKFVAGSSEPRPAQEEPKSVVDDSKVKELEAKVAELEAKVAELTTENEKLKADLEEAKAKIPAPEE